MIYNNISNLTYRSIKDYNDKIDNCKSMAIFYKQRIKIKGK